MHTKKSSYLFAIISASVLWGFFAFPLRALKNYNSEQILTWRIVIAFFIIWLIVALFKADILKKNIQILLGYSSKVRNKILVLIFISGILLTLNWFTFIYVVNHVSLKSGAFAYMVCPLITALGGNLILKEPLNRIKLVSIGIAFISIVSLATGALGEILWSVLIAVLYAFFLIIQRVVKGIDTIIMLGMQLLISLVLMLPVLWYFPQNVPYTFDFWLNVSIISIFFTIIPLLLSLYALIGLPSSTIGITIYISPMVSFCVALFYFNEVIPAGQIFYYVLLLFAVLFFNSDILWKLINPKFNSIKS